MKSITLISSFLIVTAMMSGAPRAAGVPLRVVGIVSIHDLGTLGGAEGAANDINDAGHIVGWASTPTGAAHAFFYSAGSMTDVAASIPANSQATGINASDTVVGYYLGNAAHHAFRWAPAGPLVTLNDASPPADWVSSEAHAISDTGIIAGMRSFHDSSGDHRDATVWTNDVTFSRVGASSLLFEDARDINASNLVVGSSDSKPAWWQFNPSGTAASPIPWSCAAPLLEGEALAVNARGNMVGYAQCQGATSHQHAFYWNGSSASARDLGVLPHVGQHSVATGIDDALLVSGYADRLESDGQSSVLADSAFIYDRDFGLYPLPKLPSSLPSMACRANALNNLNGSHVQLVGFCDTTGGRRAVLWDVSIRSAVP